MKLTLRIWRQSSADQPGGYQSHQLENVSPNLSLLEALDQLNEQLISAGERPVSFEHDCREGICGSCGFLVNGQAPDGNALPVGREQATSAFSTATCIGCGACVASCRNASASLFVAAKLAHLGQLPQGQPERASRADAMQRQMEAEGFGSCSSNLECEAVCPQEISADWISWMHRERRG